MIVAVATTSAAPSVLAAAAAGTVVWLALGAFQSTPLVLQQPLQRLQVCGDRRRIGVELRVRHPGRRRTVNTTSQRASPTPPGITRSGLYTASPDGSGTT